MKIFGLYLLIFAQFCGILSKPFLYNIGETLVNLLTTASSASSFSTAENSNIADYRTNKSSMKNNNVDDDDDFFKMPFDKEELSTEQPQSSQLPEFITRKIGKIIRKIQFIQQLSNIGNNNNNNNNSTVDDFDKEIDEFDKEFDEDFNKNKTTIDINKRISNNDDDDNIDDNNHKILFNPTGITVFFMEAIGSIIGLVYGAAAQFNQRETTTVNSV